MEKFTINYHTGVIEEVEVEDLAEAKAIAEEGMAYTQENVTIEQDGEVITTSYWCPVPAEDEDEVLFDFGDFGFYQPWTDELE